MTREEAIEAWNRGTVMRGILFREKRLDNACGRILHTLLYLWLGIRLGGHMNNNKFDVITITGEKFVCCCDCGKWFPSTEAFTKVYSSTAFMLCPKCANQLEQEIRRYKVKETPAADGR